MSDYFGDVARLYHSDHIRLIRGISISFISFHFIFTYLGTVAPSVRGNCFSGGRGNTFTNRKIDTTK